MIILVLVVGGLLMLGAPWWLIVPGVLLLVL